MRESHEVVKEKCRASESLFRNKLYDKQQLILSNEYYKKKINEIIN